MKYNDITVTKSSWEELVRDSFGGYRNASAYCLMYIDDKKPFLIEGTLCRCFSTACSDSIQNGTAVMVFHSAANFTICRIQVVGSKYTQHEYTHIRKLQHTKTSL